MQQINQQLMQRATESSQQPKKTRTDYANSTATIQWKEMNLPVVEFIHQAMMDTYNNLWKHTKLPLSWELMIGELSIEEIKRAVWRCMREEEYPPSPAKFHKLAKELDFDFEVSFDRFINKEALTDVEWFAAKKVGYKCRTQLSEDAAKKEWKKAVELYLKKEKAGELPPRCQKRLEQVKKTVGCDWLAPDGSYYTCPAEYYAAKMRGDTA